MSQKITTITLNMPLKLGTVNCYLIETEQGFVLVDAGVPSNRGILDAILEEAGVKPGDLKSILLTHGDFDHIGCCTFLQGKYSAPIGIHFDDIGMVRDGNMFYNRQSGSAILSKIAAWLFGFRKGHWFTPDFLIDETTDLSQYGLDAKVVHIPGHSAGSVGFLFPSGDLIGGDLCTNTPTPALSSIMPDPLSAADSLEKLRRLEVKTVFPGHGEPFDLKEIKMDA